MRNFEETPAKEYVLAKFQPGNILLVNRYTKQAFNYFEVKNSQLLSQQLNHPNLLRPLFYGTGLLYPEGQSNLKVELQNRRRAYKKQYFAEDELLNTFCPLFQCLQHLHKNNIVHGQIHPERIVLIDGQIKMRDWLVQFQRNPFYFSQQKQNKASTDDLIALGQVLAQFSTLKKSNDPFEDKDIETAVEQIIETYSKCFIFSILILLKRKTELFQNLLNLMTGKETGILQNSQLNGLYQRIKLSKANKVVKVQPVEKISSILLTPKKQNVMIQCSPNKKFNITQTNKKSSHRSDDAENKKVFNEQVKKRQIQKITKIIERSNAFVNELMARKNNNDFVALKSNSEHNGGKKNSQIFNQQHVLKKITGKNNINLLVTPSNISMYGVQPTKRAKQANLLAFSPNKRIRTISKKK